MKKVLTLFLFIISISTAAQRRSYVQIGPVAYLSTKGSNGFFGGGLGAGSSKGIAGAGLSIELLPRGKQVILPLYADVRCYFSPKKTSPYVTLQPGYNFRNNPANTIDHITNKDKGGIYAGIGAGLFVFDKKTPGLNIQLKYVFMQDKVRKTYQNNPGSAIISSTHAGFISLCASLVI